MSNASYSDIVEASPLTVRFRMSVMCSVKGGTFIDDKKGKKGFNIRRCCQSSFANCQLMQGTEQNYRWSSTLYAINTPFMMDSQADRMRRETAIAGSRNEIKETSAQRKRKKKLRVAHPSTSKERKISEVVGGVLPDLIATARELKHLSDLQTALRQTDNEAARIAAETWGCGDMFQLMCAEFHEKERGDSDFQDTIILKETERNRQASSLIGSHVCNTEDHAIIAKVDGHSFLVPGQTSFLTLNLEEFIFGGYCKVKVDGGYGLIVIDPPWLNKSVKRKKSYHMVQEEDLKQLPIKKLAGKGSIVCVWVTNNERLQQFVKDELFSAWSLDWQADWIWMKVTQYGEPVYDINSHHKKPYEQLIIGRFKGHEVMSSGDRVLTRNKDYSSIVPPSITEVKDVNVVPSETQNYNFGEVVEQSEAWEEKESFQPHKPDIPQDFVLVSVPSSLHSKKPVLDDVLAPYLLPNSRCLELFARNLTPKWTSWGNEPLCHQHLDFFESTTESASEN